MRKPHLILTTLSLCASSASFIVPALAQDTTNTQNTSERPIVYPSASIANYQATPLNDVLLSVDVIEAEEIEQSTATTVSDLISQKTGIEVSRTGGPGSVTSHFLRGQESKNFVLLVDGARVHGDSSSNVILPELSISQIEKIEVLKGNASALYGEAAIGGVINIITKSASLRDSGFVSASYGSYNSQDISAGISKYVGGFNVSFTASKAQTDGYDVQTAPATNSDKDGHNKANYDFTVERRLSPDAKLAFGLYNGESEADYDNAYTSAKGTHEYEIENKKQFIRYELKNSELVNLRFDYSQSERDRKEIIDRVQTSEQKGKRKDAKLLNISKFGNANSNVDHSLTQGLEVSSSDYDTNGNKTDRDTNAVFVGYLGEKDAHSVQTNLRHDEVSLKTTAGASADMKETSYLVGYGYKFADFYKIAVSHSTGFRAPDASSYAANINLKPETHTSNELSLQHDKDGRLLRFTLFSTNTDNAFKYVTASDCMPGNGFGGCTKNIGKAENQGLEISYSGKTDIVNYDLDVTFQDPKDKDDGSDSTQKLKRAKAYGKLNLSRQLGDYQIGGVLTYSGRKLDFGGTGTASFTRIDGYISRQLTDSVSMNLKAENITNSEYETTAGYRTPERSLFLTLKYDFVSAL